MMGYGYENAAGDRISALIDMINGGGPGRSGDTFEGGGILSLLANAVAKPYGSVRERPGHTPMGATAASMDVLRPEPVDAAVLPGSDTAVPVDMLRSVVEGAIDRAEATGGRTFREEDFAVLGRVHPEVAKLFSGVRVGDPLSPRLAMLLDAARVGFDAPSAALTFPAPTDAPSATPAVPLPLQGPPIPAPNAALTLPPLQGPPIPVPTPAQSPIAAATEPVLSFGYTAEEFRNLSPAMKNAALLQFTEDLGSMRP